MTPSLRRPALALLVGAAAAMLTVGCVPQPPAAPPQPTETQAQPVPSEAPAATETAAPSDTAAPAEGPYEITAEGQDGSVWSFEVTDIAVVETDAAGDAAEPGKQLVEVLVSGEMLEGAEPDFFHAFHIYIVDDATGSQYGLSSASNYYAEGDLFTTGTEPSFVDGVGIFHIPDTVELNHVRVTTDQGGVWDFTG
ncbi:hypothetical protein FQ330_04155 [Agrococcus sediminis]|uniref:DUF4352 domain-containing protein n=1 Tax=Agrococcus sediminis TaxID=2599924 RepID=A0A5M8QFZ9_9MICO|nr:hypothetical protein [Agrococcus sediminis]KAA6434965.1 hypothetical protein FQ330_04155 [Agrococcus sediminis]